MNWHIAATILYLIPVAYAFLYMDEEVIEVKEWMRQTGNWYPGLATLVAIVGALMWPVMMLLAMASEIWGSKDD